MKLENKKKGKVEKTAIDITEKQSRNNFNSISCNYYSFTDTSRNNNKFNI